MIELLRWIGWKSVLGLQWWMRFRCTVLGPRHLVGIAFTNEATTLAIVALVPSQHSARGTRGKFTHIQASIHRISSCAGGMFHSQSWFDWQIAIRVRHILTWGFERLPSYAFCGLLGHLLS